MRKQIKHFYEFGPFRLEPDERQLMCRDKPIALTSKAFDMPLVLVENSGHLVDKEELLKKVWLGSFVEIVVSNSERDLGGDTGVSARAT